MNDAYSERELLCPKGRFVNRFVVVAGGGLGIGAATAAHFIREGDRVQTLGLADSDQIVDTTDASQLQGYFASLDVAPDIAENTVGNANLQTILDQPVSEFCANTECEADWGVLIHPAGCSIGGRE